MANVINDALNQIAAAMATVIEGRTTATPRTENVGASAWVELPSLTADRVPGTKYVAADFPIWVTADGADRAQVAYLNDVVARAWDALTRIPECAPVSSRPAPTAQGDNRAVVITVRKTLLARSICPPDQPAPSPIPPDPIDPITPTTPDP